MLQRILEYKFEKSEVSLSTHEIINGLAGFVLDEIDYKVNKLYMLSDKLFNNKINQEIFKIENNVLLSSELANIIKKL